MHDDDVTGVSDHYLGDAGRSYLAWQAADAPLQARLNLFKFSPYVAPHHRVLDFGCSDGSLLALLPARVKIGVDANPHALARGRALGRDVRGSLRQVADASIDVAVSNHTLEHVRDPFATLADLRRVIEPGGRLVLCVPAEDPRRSPWRRGDRNHHLYAWTPLAIANLLGEAGFAVERSDLLTHAWPPYYARLWNLLPESAFHALCRLWSAIRNRRQVMAVARVQPSRTSPT